MSNIKFVDGSATIKWITFSDGTETCKIETRKFEGAHGVGSYPIGNHIQARIEDGTRDIIRIGLVKDALDRLGVENVVLCLDYMPQARADRVFEEGNPLPIAVFAQILNSYNFHAVWIADPHSDVTPALIKNCRVLGQKTLANRALSMREAWQPDFICAPDLGSVKKIEDLMVHLNSFRRSPLVGKPILKSYVQAIKVRDVTTGKIVRSAIVDEKVSGNILIIDDICDGGASFIHLAEALKERGAESVGLYVTHGIFSKGLQVFKPHLSYIECHGIVGNYVNQLDIQLFNETQLSRG